MKNTLKILLLFIAFASCDKLKIEDTAIKNTNLENNVDAQNIYDMYNNADYSLSIIYGNNYGVKTQVDAQGDVTEDLTCEVESFVLESNRPDGVLKIENNSFATLFGENISVSLTDSEHSDNYSLYAPKPMIINTLAAQPEIAIERTGNDLTWEADNESFGILLRYVIYDVDRFSNEQHKIIDSGNEFIMDNGSYNIDHLIDNLSAKSFEITLTRANGVNFVNKENKNVFFFVQTTDAHYYVINN